MWLLARPQHLAPVTLDAQLPFLRERHELVYLRAVRVVAREACHGVIGARVLYAGAHGMGEGRVVFVARATDLHRIIRKENGLVRSVGRVAGSATAVRRLRRMERLGPGELLFDLGVAPQTHPPLVPGQESLDLRGVGCVAGRGRGP